MPDDVPPKDGELQPPVGEHDEREAEDEADGGGGGDSSPALRQARAPWHFKLIAVATVVYLGYRLYQLIVLIIHHL
ncbi:MAG: hypothetical protein ACRDZT_00470 [Acidimicrobiales bacterium]